MNCGDKRFDSRKGQIPCSGDGQSTICKFPGCQKRYAFCDSHGGLDRAKGLMMEHHNTCPAGRGLDLGVEKWDKWDAE